MSSVGASANTTAVLAQVTSTITKVQSQACCEEATHVFIHKELFFNGYSEGELMVWGPGLNEAEKNTDKTQEL